MWVVAAITAALQSTLPFPALGPHVFVCRFLWIKWMERLARPRGTALRFFRKTSPALSAALNTASGWLCCPPPGAETPAAPAPRSLLPLRHLSLVSEQHRPSHQTLGPPPASSALPSLPPAHPGRRVPRHVGTLLETVSLCTGSDMALDPQPGGFANGFGSQRRAPMPH